MYFLKLDDFYLGANYNKASNVSLKNELKLGSIDYIYKLLNLYFN